MTARTPADWHANVPWQDVGEEAFEWLRTFVRFPTVNDPASAPPDSPWLAGREAEAAGWLATVLAAEGIEHELIEAAPGRVNLVARLAATASGGTPAAPITLLSHSDVVPAIREEWDVDPFAATVRDGCLHGRGTLDLKGLAIAQVVATILLHRLRVPLRREVRLLVLADEETGGEYGAQWLLRERPEYLDTALVLGEGGMSPRGVLPDGRTLHAVSVAEKGYLELELTVDGPAHHASMPGPDDAPTRLVRALQRILDRPEPVRVTPATARLLACLGDAAGGLHGQLLRRPRMVERLRGGPLRRNPLVASMFTQTCALTVLDAGYKTNVVPGRARAVLSLRLLPGSTSESVIDRLRGIAAEPRLEFRRVMHKAPNSSPFTTWAFRELTATCLAADPRAAVSPVLSPGASDARHWRAAGVPAFGWVPFPVPVGDIHGVHGTGERLAVSSFHEGLRAYFRVLARLATTDDPDATTDDPDREDPVP